MVNFRWFKVDRLKLLKFIQIWINFTSKIDASIKIVKKAIENSTSIMNFSYLFTRYYTGDFALSAIVDPQDISIIKELHQNSVNRTRAYVTSR